MVIRILTYLLIKLNLLSSYYKTEQKITEMKYYSGVWQAKG